MAEILVTGMEAVLSRIEGLATGPPRLFNVGVQNAAVMAFEKSQFYVPKDTRKLERSGRILHNSSKDEYEEYAIQYGGEFVGSAEDILPLLDDVRGGEEAEGGAGPAPYAFIVHEDLTKYHAPPTRAKYLETAVRETTDGRLRVIQDVMRFGGRFRGFGGPA